MSAILTSALTLLAANIDWAQLTYLSVLLVLTLSVFMVRGSRIKNLKHLLLWCAVFVAIIIVFAFKDEAKLGWQKVAAAVLPGSVVEGQNEITVNRASDGMFYLDGEINGQNITFMFDTGASSVALSAETARSIGLKPDELSYTATVATANGDMRSAPVTLDQITIGPITRRNVRALVSQPGVKGDTLLGHSFLDQLQSYSVNGDKLTLHY